MGRDCGVSFTPYEDTLIGYNKYKIIIRRFYKMVKTLGVTKVIRVGNSLGIVINKKAQDYLELKKDDEVVLYMDEDGNLRVVKED